jgi:Ca2+:H+ antiporter
MTPHDGRLPVWSAAVPVAAAALALILPNFTVATPAPPTARRSFHGGGKLARALRVFVFVQTVRQRDDFLEAPGADPVEPHPPPPGRMAAQSLVLLTLALFAVVILAKALSAPLSAAVAVAGLPAVVTGAIVAAVVLLPEGIAGVRSARLRRLQNSINLALGSGIASLGLRLPGVAVVSLAFGLPIDLGVSPEQVTLLALTLLVASLTLGTGRTTMLNGTIHLTLAAVFFTITVVP